MLRPLAAVPPMPILVAGALLACSMAACSKPQPPEKERPVEPQAQHAQLREAMQAPIEKAKAAEAEARQTAEAQREAIEAAGG